MSEAEGLDQFLWHIRFHSDLDSIPEPSFEELATFRRALLSQPGPESHRHSLAGLALAVEGNRQRIEEDFRGAESSFQKAAQFAASGSYAPWLAARVLDLRASMWLDLAEFRKANRDLRNAKALGGGFSVNWNLARLHLLQGDHTEAIREFLDLEDHCPANLLPKLRLNLAFSYASLGEARQAEALMVGVNFPDSGMDAAISAWIRGLIAKELDWPSSLPLLEAAHTMFALLGDQQGTALTAIDIAVEHAERGDFRQLRDTAAAAFSILLDLGAEPQAIAAFSLMAHAEAVQMDAEALRRSLVGALARRAVPS